MAIFNTSKDPVLLKKIPLRIWRLRDEIESLIQARYEKAGEKEKGVNIEDLTKEYSESTQETTDTNQPKVTIPEEKTSKGKAIISEIDMEGIKFFSSQSYLIGNSLVVEFQIPKSFRLNAVVLVNKAYDLKSKLISEKKLPYRIHLKWTFLKQNERILLREFLQSISLSKKHEKVVSEEIPSREKSQDEGEKKTA